MFIKLRKYFSSFFKKKAIAPLVDRLEDLIEANLEKKAAINDDASEIALVSNVLGLKDQTASDIMVPRADIVGANINTTLNEFIEIFSQNNFSQIPVYENTLDNVIGIARVRDFLPYIRNPDSFDLRALLKEVIYVVPSIQLLELLVEIRESENHMALVIDEFGGVDGLVTLQDVVSEIVGEIQQTHSIFPKFIKRPDDSYLVDAKMFVTECEDLLNIDLISPFLDGEDEINVETLGGLMMLIAGRMPTRGESLIHPSGVKFEIAEADPRRVKRIIIRKT